MEANLIAADLLEDHGFYDQARILRKLHEVDLSRSNELAEKRYDYEEFFDCLIGVFADLDLFRCQHLLQGWDIVELTNDWSLD